MVPCRLKYRAYGVPRGCISSATLYLLRFRDMFIETQAQGVTRKYSMRIRTYRRFTSALIEQAIGSPAQR